MSHSSKYLIHLYTTTLYSNWDDAWRQGDLALLIKIQKSVKSFI